jgi:RsiW-degrading membrane proteinase PrsW (M82 family)
MSRRRDPIQQRDDGSLDLHDVVDWEPRTAVDRAVFRLYSLLLSTFRAALVLVAFLILGAQFALGGLGAVTDPVVGGFVLLSALPALLLAAYVWRADVTSGEPLRLLVVTFLLGLLFAGFALVLNELVLAVLAAGLVQAGAVSTTATSLPPLALAAFFVFGVAPIEEGVKLLAVRLYGYRKPQFDAVIDGAVYGAAAGLGFATIENAMYISQIADAGFGAALSDGTAIATRRALAGPGHVIYSAFAGYYLGLAKFNRRYAGPIVLKGLLVAALIHGGYNVLASYVPGFLADSFGIAPTAALFVYVIVYNGTFAAILVRKLALYRTAYRESRARTESIPSERTEFE